MKGEPDENKCLRRNKRGCKHYSLLHTSFATLERGRKPELTIAKSPGNAPVSYWPIIEKLSFPLTSKGRREFVPRDQASPLLVVYC